MNKFYAGFSQSLHPGIMTKLQMKIYDINFSHSYIKFKVDEKWYIYHSTGALGTHAARYEDFILDRNPLFEYEIPTSKSQIDLLDYALAHKKSYGTFQMVGSGIAYVFGWNTNPFVDDEEEHCSMSQGSFIIENALQDRDFSKIKKVPSLWAPWDIKIYLQKNNYQSKPFELTTI